MDDIHLNMETHEVTIGPFFISHMGKIMLHGLKMNESKLYQIESISGIEETCGSVRTRSIRVAEHLRSKGLKIGDVVLICAENHNDSCIPFISTQYIGAIPVSLIVGMTHSECKHLIGIAKPRIVFSDPSMAKLLRRILTELKIIVEIVVFGEIESYTSFSDFTNPVSNEHDFECTEFDGDTISYAGFSSGTTGLPKLAALTHLSAVAGLAMLKKFVIDMRKKDDYDDGSLLSFSPLYWTPGIASVMISCISGTVRIISAKPFSLEVAKKALEKYNPSTMYVNPDVLVTLSKYRDLNKIDFSSLRSISTTGNRLEADVILKIEKFMPNGKVMTGYGGVEMGSITHGPFMSGSVGRVHPWLKWKVVDVNTGEILGTKKQGEFCVKGITVFKEYHNNPELTKAAIDADGYYKSGDLVYYDEDENIFIVDRIEEIIKYKKFEIITQELESLISSLPEVFWVAVVGIADKINGELPAAFVQKVEGTDIDAQKIKDVIKNNLPEHCQLRGGVAFVEKMPMTYTGKINRWALRKLRSSAKRE